MTLISVVIPVYNRFDLLKRSLSALTLQTFRFFDVWICDDGSSEDISPIIDEYKSVLDINLVRTPHSGGPAAPRNRAIRCSHSQYIAFLDSDDYWLPDKLNESVRAIAKGANFVYHDLIVVEKGKIKRHVLGIPKLVHSYEMKADNLLVKTFSLGNSIPTSSVVIDRELLKQVNFFDERIRYISIEDAIAWLNVAKMRPTLKKIKKPLGFYEMGLQNNISSFTNIYKQLARTRSLYLYL